MTTPDPDRPDARVVRHEIEVAGTPEQVWEQIATGPGLSTWFVATEMDGREGGEIVTHHGPFAESTGRITVFQPPHRFVFEEADWFPGEGDAPPWATEILVEARSGDTCIVRLVSGFFADGDGWEDQLEGTDEGWWLGLRILQLYRARWAGLAASHLWATHTSPRDRREVDAALRERLGLGGAAPGAGFRSPPGAPVLAGTVEKADAVGVLLAADQPAPGVFHVSVQAGAALAFGGFDPAASVATVHAILYGPDSAALAGSEQTRWNAWLAADDR